MPAADLFFNQLAKRTSARIVSVGISCGDLRAEKIISTTEGSEFEIHHQGKVHAAFLPMVGRHMVSNALLAVAAGMECSISLEEGIERTTSWFLNNKEILDKRYNAFINH